MSTSHTEVDSSRLWFLHNDVEYRPTTLGRLLTSCPVLGLVAPFTAGIALWWLLPLTVWGVTLAAATVLALSLLRLRRTFARQWALVPAIVAGGLAAGAIRGAVAQHTPFLDGPGEARFAGVVVGERRVDSLRTTLIVDIEQLTTSDGRQGDGLRGQLTLQARVGGALGRRVSGLARLRTPLPDPAGAFDRRAWMMEQGLRCDLVADSAIIGERHLTLAGATGAVRDNFEEALRRAGLADHDCDFLRALVLADRSRLQPTLRQAFVDCGTAHVLAVSGLHVGLVAAVALALFKPLGIYARLIALLLLWLYAALVGLAPPIVRAATMFTVMVLARLRGRGRVHHLHSLSLALLIIELADPAAVASYGLWLSVLSVATLPYVTPPVERALKDLAETLVLYPPYKKRRNVSGLTQKLAMALAVSLATQAITTPLILRMTGEFPTYFWLNNLWLLPLIELLFISTLVCWALAWIPGVNLVAGLMVKCQMTLISGGVETMSRLPFSVLRVGHFTTPEMVSMLLTCALGIALAVSQSRRLIAPTVGSVALLLAAGLADDARLASQKGVTLYTHGREVGLVSYHGMNATHYRTDTASRNLAYLSAQIDRRLGNETRRVLPLPANARLVCHGMTIALIDQPPATADTLDVCVLCRDLPTDLLPPARQLMVTPACHYPALYGDARRLAWRDAATITQSDLWQQLRELLY